MKAIAIPEDRYFAEEEREDASRNRDSSKVGKLIGNKGGTESSLVNNTLLTQVAMNNNRLRTVAKGSLHSETLFEFHKRCLLKYKELHGNITIKQKFTVPWNDSWPEEMWDMRLGKLLTTIRQMKIHLSKKEELIAIGVCYDNQNSERFYGWDNISLALTTYKTLNGHILIPQKFIIPVGSTVWPKHLSGMHLGSIVSMIKNRNTHSTHRGEILAMGIKYTR